MDAFVGSLSVDYVPTAIRHKNQTFASFYMATRQVEIRPKTPPILMTEAVWDQYRKAKPATPSVKEGWVKKIEIKVPGYNGNVFGCDVIHPTLKG